LGLAPLDLLSLPEAQGIPPELSDRIRRFVWANRPAGSTDVQIVTERDPAWKPNVVALTEWLTLAQAAARLLNASRPLLPADLVAQGDPPGTIDVTELEKRADAAEAQMRAALASLQKTSATDSDLFEAAFFGGVASVPNIDSTEWPAQIASAISELATRGG